MTLSYPAKTALLALAQPALRANGWWYARFRAPRSGDIRVHLGPGPDKYIPGWINVDANLLNRQFEVWADLRHPLPFRSHTLTAVYSHHVIEHLPDLAFHFREVHRCLRPGGIYRVGGPNGDMAIQKFVENDKAWFTHFPVDRRSIGGRFENFVFCGRDHLTILTYSFLEELMTDAGFTDIRLCQPAKETGYPELFNDCLTREYEWDEEFPHTLLVEGRKA